MSEKIQAVIERVTFYSDETGFSVLQARSSERDRRHVTIVGNLPPVSPGEQVEAEGEWRNDRVHGMQFQAESIAIRVPTGRKGIEKFLASGLVRGVGPSTAKALVGEFGEEVLEVIEKFPHRLQRVPGIGKKRAAMIAEGWGEQRAIRELVIFLHEHGVGTARAQRIFRRYGPNAIGLIRSNPYRLASDVRGIGFVIADRIALSMGLEKDSIFRARAGLSHVLSEAQSSGHCGLPASELLDRGVELLEIGEEILRRALELEIADGRLVRDTAWEPPMIFLPWLFEAEQTIAERMNQLVTGSPPWPAIDEGKAIDWVQKRLKIDLSASQQIAIRTVLESNVTIITGGPGVGKTTLVNSILRILDAKGVDIALAAPTGRAAKRLSESTGRSAKTIHRLLEINPQTGSFTRNEENPLDCDLLVIDETSMVDVPLMSSVCRSLREGSALILVGDVDQLPSVGPGQVLLDLIRSDVVSVVRLTEIFRQARESGIVTGAHAINEGRMPQFDTKESSSQDFFFIGVDDPEKIRETVVGLVRSRLPKRFGLDPMREIQVLVPMNRGGVGVESLNLDLQAALNPGGERLGRLDRFGTKMTVGDRLMQTENDYEKDVFNGDLGIVREIDPEDQVLRVEFDGRDVLYGFDEVDQLMLAYATTIHKSQGSEYRAVVIPLSTQHYVMLQRNLVYTAVTRGRELVVIVGQKRALGQAVRSEKGKTRWGRLLERLRVGSGS
ncbi:MAG: ATP-dependent RecD-like DNA helicase [Thermoanaerobaculia bacterium]|nr:ATP-dependent RecD-like DNA helicase [Thermoanaerobaculia bacterium]